MSMRSRWLTGRSPEARATTRVVAALSISALAEWGGASSVLPLLPVYLRHQGSSLTLVGFTMAAFFAAAVLVQYPVGRLSDRVGRRTIQVAGLATYALASVLFVFLSAPVAAFVLRALQGAGVGVVDVANSATLGEVVPEHQRGRAFAALYGTRTVGMAVGPFVGGLLGLSGMKILFLGAAVLVLSAAAPILAFAPKAKGYEHPSGVRRSPLWRNRSVLGVGVAFLAGGIVIGMYEVCWSLLLTLRGAAPWQLGLSWTFFALPFAIMSLPAGWLVDHMDRRYLVALALLGSAAFAAVYPFIHSVAWLIGLGIGEAVTVSLGAPAESAQLSGSVPSHELGRAQGAVFSAQTAAVAVSASISGALFGIHAWLPYVLAAGGVMCCLAVVAVLWRTVSGRGSVVPAAAPGTSLPPQPAVVPAVADAAVLSEEPAASALGHAG